MSGRTIKRQPQTGARRPQPRQRQPVRKVSRLDRLVAALPVGQETLTRIATWTILGGGCAVALVVASWAGVPALVGAGVASAAGRAGFKVDQIEITGLKRMDRMSVYAVALDQKSTAMTALDLEAIRQKLLRYGWIADAHVSRRLPDTLLIDVVERQPAAVWQEGGQLTLIDRDGVLLEPVRADAVPDLPLVVGPGADREEPAYQALIAAVPALKGRIKAATWIGNRRWDLLFDTGETLALPEDGAQSALISFAEMDGARPLLGKGWLRFDLRDPTKLVARKPGAALAHQIGDDGRPAPSASPTPAPTHDTSAAQKG